MKQVCCFGNSLHGDDGIGLAVYEHLHQKGYKSNVHYFADVPINALNLLTESNSVILVDAIAVSEYQGEVLELTIDELKSHQTDIGSSAHLNSISYLLNALENTVNFMPKIKIYGVGINNIDRYHIGLSDEAEKAVIHLSRMIETELEAEHSLEQ